jgi:muramoyltetrapeptide carboxypeptidase
MITGDIVIPYSYPLAESVRLLRPGPEAQGTLIGGNLRNLLYLVGTPYFTRETEILLFFEEIGIPLHDIDAQLTHLKLAGVFEKVKGLVVGQLVGCEDEYKVSDTIDALVLRLFKEHDFPIISNVPLGHTGDKITVPIGCKARILSQPPALELCESPFAAR